MGKNLHIAIMWQSQTANKTIKKQLINIIII